MNDYLEESKEVMEDTVFGESYDKELATYEGGFDEGRQAGFDDGFAAGREDGFAAGREEGIAAGQEEIRMDTAKKMKDEGIDVSLINKITGLSLEKIQKL